MPLLSDLKDKLKYLLSLRHLKIDISGNQGGYNALSAAELG